MTLTEFLLARISEDEVIARRAAPSPWTLDEDGCCVTTSAHESESSIETHLNGAAEHLQRWDPARVLAECAAKRRIIDLADEASSLDMSVDLDRRVGPRDMIEEPYVGDAILAALALPYADHPDYPGEQQK